MISKICDASQLKMNTPNRRNKKGTKDYVRIEKEDVPKIVEEPHKSIFTILLSYVFKNE